MANKYDALTFWDLKSPVDNDKCLLNCSNMCFDSNYVDLPALCLSESQLACFTKSETKHQKQDGNICFSFEILLLCLLCFLLILLINIFIVLILRRPSKFYLILL